MELIEFLRAHLLRHSTSAIKIGDYELAKEIAAVKNHEIERHYPRLIERKIWLEHKLSRTVLLKWYYLQIHKITCKTLDDMGVKYKKYRDTIHRMDKLIKEKNQLTATDVDKITLGTISFNDVPHLKFEPDINVDYLITAQEQLEESSITIQNVDLTMHNYRNKFAELLTERSKILNIKNKIYEIRVNLSLTKEQLSDYYKINNLACKKLRENSREILICNQYLLESAQELHYAHARRSLLKEMAALDAVKQSLIRQYIKYQYIMKNYERDETQKVLTIIQTTLNSMSSGRY